MTQLHTVRTAFPLLFKVYRPIACLLLLSACIPAPPPPSLPPTLSPSTAPRLAPSPHLPTPIPPPPVPTPTVDLQPEYPIRAAFYHAGYPQAWSQGEITPFTYYHPADGLYDPSQEDVLRGHIQALQYGGMDAGLLVWSGPGSPEDHLLARMLDLSRSTPLRWAVVHASEQDANPTREQVAADLDYLTRAYGEHPAYLRVEGEMVVFVLTGADDTCEVPFRWNRARSDDLFIAMSTLLGHAGCPVQPDAWYPYTPQIDFSQALPDSVSISPGYWKIGEGLRLFRDPAAWTGTVRRMLASPARFHIITSFNDWASGTALEPAEEWASPSGFGQYLDVLNDDAATLPPPSVVLSGAGDISVCWSQADVWVSDLFHLIPGQIFTLGDNSNQSGTYEQFTGCFTDGWGRFFDRIHPTPGNHDYVTPGARGYYDYFGARAGEPGKGYYSYDLGDWHIVVLNGNCWAVGGCERGSEQETWLRQDLAASSAHCQVAYWHQDSPAFGNDALYNAFWQALYDHGVELVLNGHNHQYRRFLPRDPLGWPDLERGVRQFIAGTGGARVAPVVRSEYAGRIQIIDGVFGLLVLRLHPDSYEWQFVPAQGEPVTDYGRSPCH